VIAKNGITSDSMTKAMALMEPEKSAETDRNRRRSTYAATLLVRKTERGEEVLESKRLAGYLGNNRAACACGRLIK